MVQWRRWSLPGKEQVEEEEVEEVHGSDMDAEFKSGQDTLAADDDGDVGDN